MWTNEQIRMLIDERKINNKSYHDLVEGGRKFFWKEVAAKINLKFGTRFTGQQAKEKFQGIVQDCHVSKIFN